MDDLMSLIEKGGAWLGYLGTALGVIATCIALFRDRPKLKVRIAVQGLTSAFGGSFIVTRADADAPNAMIKFDPFVEIINVGHVPVHVAEAGVSRGATGYLRFYRTRAAMILAGRTPTSGVIAGPHRYPFVVHSGDRVCLPVIVTEPHAADFIDAKYAYVLTQHGKVFWGAGPLLAIVQERVMRDRVAANR